MKATVYKAEAKHQTFRSDCLEIFKKHGNDLTSQEMLALASHLVGQLIAMQDQRTMTSGAAMEIVAQNIEVGNADVFSDLATKSEGSA